MSDTHLQRRAAAAGGPHVPLAEPPLAVPRPIGTPAPAAPRGDCVLRCRGLRKAYFKTESIPVLCGVDLAVQRGELLAIVGQSGSGKSTLLHLLATLDQPDDGEVWLDDRRIDHLPPSQRDAIRNQQIGIIFQFYHLLPELTALENVLVPLMIRHSAWHYWRHRREWRQRALHLLEEVGLGHRARHRPREMSGGEMQRTAIARALIGGPSILLADEPTGNLDRATGEGILRVLHRLNRQQDLTIVIVTHDLAIAESADRVVRLAEGRIETASD